MKIALSTFIILSFFFKVFGQNSAKKETSAIVAEGKMLYRAEMASWTGADIFLEKYTDQRANVGGYFSYTDNHISNCIFFSKGENPKVIYSVSFDGTYDKKVAKYESESREFSGRELDLYTIRKKALAVINADSMFKTYNNTLLNLIPLTENGEKKVYVLTTPQKDGVIIFGNDYLLLFDEKNNLKDKKKLHENIIITDLSKPQGIGTSIIRGMHTHLPSSDDYITPTDICTLMLYEKQTKWEQYIVLSDSYVSIWDCKSDQLQTMTKKEWEKIQKDKGKVN